MPNTPTLASLAADLDSGATSARKLVEQCLAKIADTSGEGSRAFIHVDKEGAIGAADAMDRLRKAHAAPSPFAGIPVSIKDLFDIKGQVTRAGSRALEEDCTPAEADAPVVARLRRAGFIVIGRTNMTEFAYSGIGLNPHYGTPRNPNGSGPARAPGGSSSASGVVVAAGILPLAIGSDTGGSIRIPASFNGVVGYKSSTGHYPMDGVFPLSRTLDTLGPLAHSVADCVLADAVLRGLRKPAIKARPVKGIELLVPETVVFDGFEAAVATNFEAAVARLKKAGVKVKRIKLPVFLDILDLFSKHGHLLGPEALALHWERVNGPDAERMDARVAKRMLAAGKMTAVDLVITLEARRRMIAETDALIGDALVAFPTTPTVAMPIAPLEADQDVFFRHNARTLRHTTFGNFLDWCGVAIPNGTDGDGMPTSFLLSAPHGRDAAMLSAALTLETSIRG